VDNKSWGYPWGMGISFLWAEGNYIQQFWRSGSLSNKMDIIFGIVEVGIIHLLASTCHVMEKAD